VKNWKKRWFVLKDDVLYYFKGKEDNEAAGSISVENCSIQTANNKTGKKNSFEILTQMKERNYYLYAETASEMEEWISILSKVSNSSKKDVEESIIFEY